MNPPAPLRILYFAWLRERVGTAEESVAPPPEVADVGALMQWLAARHDGFARGLASGTLRCAVNQSFAAPDTPVAPGDEVAFFPPVTGG